MTFAAYGLVIHSGTRDALTGGRAYLIMAVLGEGLILGGLLWGAGNLGVLTLGELREGLATLEQGAWIGVLLRSEEHTSELQSRPHLVCRLLLEKKKQHSPMT